MPRIRTNIRKGFFGIATAIVILAPLATFSSVSAATDTGCTPPSSSSYGPGTHVPTGSSAPAFIYQCPDSQNPSKPYVGDWLSAHYVYYPQTNDTEPLVAPTYTYNNQTGEYDYPVWVYNANGGTYQQQTDSVDTPPAGANVIGGPAPVTPPSSDSSDPSDGSDDSGASADTSTIGGTNANGSNTINNNTNNTGTVNNGTTVNVGNTIIGTATSGSATLDNDAIAGDATSGDVVSEADIINLLQSSSNALGSGTNVATFTYNIDGNVDGDLLFDPSTIDSVQGDNSINNNATNTLTINNDTDASITNNLTLGSSSGDAAVTNDAQGGSATSGSADTVANIVNSISSAITAGKSFIGTININGNLNGNILLPANFVTDLMADNVPTVTVPMPSSNTSTNTSTVTNTNNEGISNTVTSTANSGNATVADDASAGSATSGSANTHVTAFNLTGSNVIASNDILVFVNVLGSWTGLILNAPAGATAAELGGGVTENSTDTSNSTVNNTTNENITNNLNLNAQSGNATVAHDAIGGNATSGNANTAANLMNIEGSTLNLSNWFGILFINVFGTWNGSLGVASANNGSTPVATGDLIGTTSRLERFLPPTTTTTSAPTGSSTTSSSSSLPGGTVLAAHTSKVADTAQAPSPVLQGPQRDLWLPAIGIVFSATILGSERFLSRRHQSST